MLWKLMPRPKWHLTMVATVNLKFTGVQKCFNLERVINALWLKMKKNSSRQSWMSRDVSRSRYAHVSVSDLESLGKWSCLDRDMKKFWI